MAVYDLEEQEQIAELKAWWKSYGNTVLLIVIVTSLTISGYFGWRYYSDRQALEAGELYVQLLGAVGSNDQKKVIDIGATMMDKYSRTGYAQFAALAAGKAAFDSADLAAARKNLTWAVEHAKEDGTRDLARLRLAVVMIDEKKYEEALGMLKAEPVEAMTALFADLRGDALNALAKPAEARSAYQLAFDKTDAKSPYRGVIQGKLEALGDAK